jgi:signal transduction histidine kinase
VLLTGEETLLEIMMSNLIENAIKYSPRDTEVEVKLYKDKNGIFFSVKDEGPGIEEEEKSKIFEKFYRVGNEATRTAKGTGLGLYLCKQIAKDHNATISVRNNDIKGAVFTVTLPI